MYTARIVEKGEMVQHGRGHEAYVRAASDRRMRMSINTAVACGFRHEEMILAGEYAIVTEDVHPVVLLLRRVWRRNVCGYAGLDVQA